jgi:DNA-binding NarL/FixJ family response regulator
VSDGELAVISYPVSQPSDRSLTRAEREVAVLLLDGKTHAEIGRSRKTATRTVANQVASVLRKLGVHSRAELLVRYGSQILSS